jgi:hypothetical protein
VTVTKKEITLADLGAICDDLRRGQVELHNLVCNIDYGRRQTDARLATMEQQMAQLLTQNATIMKMAERLGGLLMQYIDQNEPDEIEDEPGVEQLTTPAKKR